MEPLLESDSDSDKLETTTSTIAAENSEQSPMSLSDDGNGVTVDKESDFLRKVMPLECIFS